MKNFGRWGRKSKKSTATKVSAGCVVLLVLTIITVTVLSHDVFFVVGKSARKDVKKDSGAQSWTDNPDPSLQVPGSSSSTPGADSVAKLEAMSEHLHESLTLASTVSGTQTLHDNDPTSLLSRNLVEQGKEERARDPIREEERARDPVRVPHKYDSESKHSRDRDDGPNEGERVEDTERMVRESGDDGDGGSKKGRKGRKEGRDSEDSEGAWSQTTLRSRAEADRDESERGLEDRMDDPRDSRKKKREVEVVEEEVGKKKKKSSKKAGVDAREAAGEEETDPLEGEDASDDVSDGEDVDEPEDIEEEDEEGEVEDRELDDEEEDEDDGDTDNLEEEGEVDEETAESEKEKVAGATLDSEESSTADEAAGLSVKRPGHGAGGVGEGEPHSAKKKSKKKSLDSEWEEVEAGGQSLEGTKPKSKKSSTSKSKSKEKVPKPKRPKRPKCEIDFLNAAGPIHEPPPNADYASFKLSYVDKEERPEGLAGEAWEPRFGGHPTVEDHENSFRAVDQTIHCGFVKTPEGGSTGFDVTKADREYMRSCHSVAVSSCIFGNWDHARSPTRSKLTTSSKEHACFTMFVDKESYDGMVADGEGPDERGRVGLWRVVLVRNLPYDDPRRTGKIPKLLAHRLFPNSRYSLWVDSKLRLEADPFLVLERYLWRPSMEFAISNHYDRHCVFEEVAQNKKLNKYNHSIIDSQFETYLADGLTRFDPNATDNLLPSYVPEGSYIVRAHTPMSNLFSCLWFNEVDRWTSRDQLSFAYTFLKLARTNVHAKFHLNMFQDCERKAMVKLFRHKPEEAFVLQAKQQELGGGNSPGGAALRGLAEGKTRTQGASSLKSPSVSLGHKKGPRRFHAPGHQERAEEEPRLTPKRKKVVEEAEEEVEDDKEEGGAALSKSLARRFEAPSGVDRWSITQDDGADEDVRRSKTNTRREQASVIGIVEKTAGNDWSTYRGKAHDEGGEGRSTYRSKQRHVEDEDRGRGRGDGRKLRHWN